MHPRRFVSLALVLLTSACADAVVEPVDPGDVRIAVVAAADSVVACGEEIPVTVTVTNTRGRPVPNFLLNFNVLAGGGSMYAGAALTNSKGVASDLWTVGPTANVLNTFAVRTMDGAGVGTEHFRQSALTHSRIAVQGWGGTGMSAMDPDGSNVLELTPGLSYDLGPAWSPDGSRIAFTSDREDARWEIYVMDSDSGNVSRLTTSRSSSAPAWSPDGSRIAYESMDIIGVMQLHVINTDGSGDVQLTTGLARSTYAGSPAWSPDGSRILFTSDRHADPANGNYNEEIYVVSADGTNQTRLTDHIDSDRDPAWSPDGRSIAFTSSRSGDYEIWVMDADGSFPRQLTVGGGMHPYWSPDGGRIVFGSGGTFYTMNPDGSDVAEIVVAGVTGGQPSWSGCLPF